MNKNDLLKEKAFMNSRIVNKLTIPMVVIVLWIILSITTKTFLTLDNISNLLRQTSLYGIVAVG